MQKRQPRPQPRAGLDQGHLAELGVVGQDLRDGLGGRDVAHPLAFDAALAGAEQRHEDAGNLGELFEQLDARGVSVLDEAVDELVEDRLSFADHECVEAVGERQRVGDHGCAAGDHDRRALVAVGAERRDAGGLQGADHVVVIDLVGERVGDDGGSRSAGAGTRS